MNKLLPLPERPEPEKFGPIKISLYFKGQIAQWLSTFMVISSVNLS